MREAGKGEHHQIDPVVSQKTQPRCCIGWVPKHQRRDVAAPGVGQTRCFRTIAHHEDDFGRRTRLESAKQRLEIAAAAGNGHGYAHRHGGGR